MNRENALQWLVYTLKEWPDSNTPTRPSGWHWSITAREDGTKCVYLYPSGAGRNISAHDWQAAKAAIDTNT